MKVRVSILGAYMAMELEDMKALRLFRKMTELLCTAGAEMPVKEIPEPVKTGPEPMESAEAGPEPEEDAAEEDAPEEPTEELPVMPEKIAPLKRQNSTAAFCT